MEQEVKMNITKAIRDKIKKEVDIDEILPDKLPVYVSSFVYMFGIITLVSLIVIILSGFIMVSKGVLWYQTSPLGFFFRSMHFWGVQVFFFFLTLHFLTIFFMAGWRGGRAITWIIGIFIAMFAIIETFMGILLQGGSFAQWNQVQAKDAFNAVGITSFLNLLNNGQLEGLHFVVFPSILVLLVGIHIFLVRQKGLVPPIEDNKNG